MSSKIFCDIKNCQNEGVGKRIAIVKIEVVPTGNSDYSSYEESRVDFVDRDLCKKHQDLYSKRMDGVLIENNEGLTLPGEKNE